MTSTDILSNRLKNAQFTRIVAFGSSNTERRIAGMHWFDCFELACRATYGPHTSCINSGIGGDSTLKLLARMERDCLSFAPNFVFLTVGGNDSNPDNKIDSATYREKYIKIIQKIKAINALPILQTYYSVDNKGLSLKHAESFSEMMQIVRDLSKETDCMLIDHLTRWEPLRIKKYDTYRSLMIDNLHVNATGNLLLGLDIVREFGLRLPEDPLFNDAIKLQALLDELSK